MEINKQVFEDNTEYGKFRETVYLNLKDYNDLFDNMDLHEISREIDDVFFTTVTFSLGTFGYLLKQLKTRLDMLDFAELSGDPGEAFNKLTVYLDQSLDRLNSFNITDTNFSLIAEQNGVEGVQDTAAPTGVFKTFFTIGTLDVTVTEDIANAYVCDVEAQNINTGSQHEFEIHDQGNLYDEVFKQLITDASLQEGYKRGQVVKDLLGNHFKIIKKEGDHYKIKDFSGGTQYVKQTEFDQVSKKTRYKKQIPLVQSKGKLKETVNTGSSVNTTYGTGKVSKIDNDDVWVTLDNDANIDGVNYTKGTDVAVKKASLVSEESTDFADLALSVKAKIQGFNDDDLNKAFTLTKIRGLIPDFIEQGKIAVSTIANKIKKDYNAEYGSNDSDEDEEDDED